MKRELVYQLVHLLLNRMMHIYTGVDKLQNKEFEWLSRVNWLTKVVICSSCCWEILENLVITGVIL